MAKHLSTIKQVRKDVQRILQQARHLPVQCCIPGSFFKCPYFENDTETKQNGWRFWKESWKHGQKSSTINISSTCELRCRSKELCSRIHWWSRGSRIQDRRPKNYTWRVQIHLQSNLEGHSERSRLWWQPRRRMWSWTSTWRRPWSCSRQRGRHSNRWNLEGTWSKRSESIIHVPHSRSGRSASEQRRARLRWWTTVLRIWEISTHRLRWVRRPERTTSGIRLCPGWRLP